MIYTPPRVRCSARPCLGNNNKNLTFCRLAFFNSQLSHTPGGSSCHFTHLGFHFTRYIRFPSDITELSRIDSGSNMYLPLYILLLCLCCYCEGYCLCCCCILLCSFVVVVVVVIVQFCCCCCCYCIVLLLLLLLLLSP